ncbi:unnamed protein product, partial [Heterotrigona itama]
TEGYRVERNSASELTGEAEAEAVAKARASFACRSCISVIPGNTNSPNTPIDIPYGAAP